MSSARFSNRNESPTPSGPPKKRPKPNYSVSFAPAMATAPTVATEPAVAAAPASTSASATVQEPTTYAMANAIDLANVLDSPHTPPNAPRRARDDKHPATYIAVHQVLFDKLYSGFRKDFEEKGLLKSNAAVLRFAAQRLAEQKKILAQRTKERREIFNNNAARNEEIQKLNGVIAGLSRTIKRLSAALEVKEGQLKEQDKFIKAQDKLIPEQEHEIQEQATIIGVEKHHIVEQGKHIIEQRMRIGYLEKLLLEHGWDKGWLEDAAARMEKGESAKEAMEAIERG
jgi:hypothetical protein